MGLFKYKPNSEYPNSRILLFNLTIESTHGVEEANLEQLLLQLLNWLAPTLELADFSEESLERLTTLALGLEVLDCLVLGVLVTHHFGERLGCGCLHQ